MKPNQKKIKIGWLSSCNLNTPAKRTTTTAATITQKWIVVAVIVGYVVVVAFATICCKLKANYAAMSM